MRGWPAGSRCGSSTPTRRGIRRCTASSSGRPGRWRVLEHPNLAVGVLEANGDGPEPYVAFSVSDDVALEGLGPAPGLAPESRRPALR